jgi:uncharacterized integral membrane protein
VSDVCCQIVFVATDRPGVLSSELCRTECDDMIYLLTAIGLTPGGSSTVHIYTETIHRTTKLTTVVGRLSGNRAQSGQSKINDKLTA